MLAAGLVREWKGRRNITRAFVYVWVCEGFVNTVPYVITIDGTPFAFVNRVAWAGAVQQQKLVCSVVSLLQWFSQPISASSTENRNSVRQPLLIFVLFAFSECDGPTLYFYRVSVDYQQSHINSPPLWSSLSKPLMPWLVIIFNNDVRCWYKLF